MGYKLSIYTNLVDTVESENILNAVVRFDKDGIIFLAFMSDVAETVRVLPSIVDDLSEMGFETSVIGKNTLMACTYAQRVTECCGDSLSDVWDVLRKNKRYNAFNRHIKNWTDKFIAEMGSEASPEYAKADSDKDAITLADYKNRQLRCYTNKLKHGFNVTDFQKEARFILKELSELMDAIEHNDVENLIEELGDIVIFCYGIAEMAHKDLDTQVFKKMGINENRVYHRNEHGDFVRQDN